MIISSHPNCTENKENCRIKNHGGTQTLMAAKGRSIYDGNGVLLSGEDPNIYTVTLSCSVCERVWQTKTRKGVVESVNDLPSSLVLKEKHDE